MGGGIVYPFGVANMAARLSEDRLPSQAPDSEEIRQTLKRILSSKYFAQAPKKQKFLQLICEAHLNGRASEINEYMVGYEVFDRNESYNPALDPIVRVGAHELRKKLELYYENEGQNDEIVLGMPVGSYMPAFTRRPRPKAAEISIIPVPEPLRPALGLKTKAWIILLSLVVISMLIAIVMLVFANKKLRQQIEQGTQQQAMADVYKPVWEPFLTDASPTLLVLSNPPVYRFWNPVDPDYLSKRSIDLTSTEARSLAETLGRERFVIKRSPVRRLVLSYDEYTGIGEALGLHRVSALLNKVGNTAVVKQSRTVSAEDLKNHDVILLGSVWVNEWSGKIPIKEDFIHGASATIINENPLPGEQHEYSARFDEESGRLVEDYALITVRPNISGRNKVMVLAGTHSEGTEAAAEFVSREVYLSYLNQRLLQFGSAPPKYYQVLLRVAVDNGIPTTISIVTVHQLHSDRQ